MIDLNDPIFQVTIKVSGDTLQFVNLPGYKCSPGANSFIKKLSKIEFMPKDNRGMNSSNTS